MTLQIGETVGPYEIISPLGQGGMATVYKAHHKRLDRYVAIKVMHTAFMQDDSFLARFEREARIVARLEHPNIVPVYDFSDHNGQPYLAMKYIEGPTLKRRAMKQGITLEETAHLLTPVADALDYAHAHDVLHRDMKPSNILLDLDDRPYITDFGLARIAQMGASTMSADMMLGTPFYISPEQAQGSKDLDSRTDIYAFGVILYELITGAVPFNADAAYAIVYSHIHAKPDLPSVRNPQLPKELDPILLKAMAKNPQDRYATARALMHDFNAVLASQGRNVPYTPKTLERDTSSPTLSMAAQPTDSAQPQAQSLKGPGQTLIGDSEPTAEKKPAPTPATDPKQRRVEVEGSLNLGDLAEQIRRVRWDEFGERMKSRVENFASMIEEGIDSEMKSRGVKLEDANDASEEAVRKRVAKRIKARQELAAHIATYLSVNAGLVFIWLMFTRGFFWPMFPIFFWGLGVVGQAWDYMSKYGGGDEKRREWMEREVERELQRSQSRRRKSASDTESKAKNIALDESGAEYDMIGLDRLDGDTQRPRINAEGELTDSFVEEARRGRQDRR
jgi:serine/threonine protein kinase